MFRRPFLLAIMAAAMLGLLPPSGSSAAAIADDAKIMVQNLADSALSILADKNITSVDREARLRRLLLDNFNVRAIGRFVISNHWRTASAAERARFLRVFETYVVKTYTVQLGQYAGEKFKVLSAEPDKRGVVVISEVLPPDRPPVELKWRVRQSKSRNLRIVDVVVENISMALTQRQEFASVIQQRGGTLAGLITALEEKIQELDAKDTAQK